MPKVGLDTPRFSPAYGLIADKKYFSMHATSHRHSHRTTSCSLKAAQSDSREILKLNQTIGSQKVPILKNRRGGNEDASPASPRRLSQGCFTFAAERVRTH